MIEGHGRFTNRRTKTAGKNYDRFFIYIPTEVARDGTFPFEEGDLLVINIESDKLVIKKAK